jgi:hypothetical protein
MATQSLVEPLDTVTPEVTPAVAPEETAPALPPELLKLPSVQVLLAGSPPALSADIKTYQNKPESKLIAKNKDVLLDAGFNFYRSLDGVYGVMFNQMHITPDEIKAADQAGQLLTVAPLVDQVERGLNQTQVAEPTPTSVPPTSASGGSLPASAQRDLMSARVSNMQPGPPASTGAKPGAGRILNSILKPVL